MWLLCLTQFDAVPAVLCVSGFYQQPVTLKLSMPVTSNVLYVLAQDLKNHQGDYEQQYKVLKIEPIQKRVPNI